MQAPPCAGANRASEFISFAQIHVKMHNSSKGIDSTSNPTSHSLHTTIPHNNTFLHFQSQTHLQSYNCTTHQATDTLIQHTALQTRNHPLHSFQNTTNAKASSLQKQGQDHSYYKNPIFTYLSNVNPLFLSNNNYQESYILYARTNARKKDF